MGLELVAAWATIGESLSPQASSPMGTSKPQPSNGSPESSADRLDSWKEIAAYLKRDERTVRRWEKEGLPVRRKVHKKQASVFAYRAEIDAWWNDGRERLEAANAPGPETAVRTELPRKPRWKSIWFATLGGAAIITAALAFNIAGMRDRLFARSIPPIRSIVVLPLQNLSGDPSQDYFADGMTDELITELAQVSSLRVISRTSAMRYKTIAKTAPEIARELNVDSVLEGSVGRSNGRVRITAQLIAARSDEHLWAHGYEGEAKDVLEMQAAVARDVVKQIRLRLTSTEQGRLSRSRPVNPEAHEAYLKGLYYWNKRDQASLEKAISSFNQAINIDPSYPLPYAGIAQSYIPLTYLGYVRGADIREKVAAALGKALELDDSLAEAHTALGSAKHFYEYDWAGAEREFNRAIQLNPSYATAHQWYAQMLGSEGRGDEALAEHRRAQGLDPLSPIIISGTGHRLYRLRRYEEARVSLKDALEMDDNFPHAHWNLGLVCTKQRDFPSAIKELQKADTLFRGSSLVLGGLGYAYAASGDQTGARKVLLRLEEQARQQYVDPDAFALVYAGLGNKDKAFEWLIKATDDREGWVTFVNAEPMLDNLRSDPRFEGLLRRIGLVH